MKMFSSSVLPALPAPEHLKTVVQASSNIDLKLYLSALGISNNLKRISPEINMTSEFSPTDIPDPFTDPPIIRSEPWPSSDLTKSSKTRRWIQFKTKFISCIKSVKCRFTALGLLLGWLTSLGALIPILIFWLKSGSTSGAPTLCSTSTGFSFDVSTAVPICDISYCQEIVIFNSDMTIISLSLVVTVQSTEGETFAGVLDANSAISYTQSNETTQLIYIFSVSNSSLPAGNYTCGVEFNVPGVNHTTSADTYTMTATNLCGTTITVSGNF